LTRFSAKVLIDAALAAMAWPAATLFLDQGPAVVLFRQVAPWVLTGVFVSVLFQLPRQHYRLFGRRDLGRLSFAALGVILLGLGLARLGLWAGIAQQAGTLVLAGLITGMLWMVFRLALAEAFELRGAFQRVHADLAGTRERVIIVGAGHAGLMILQELSRHPELGQKVIGFVDDAPEKRSIRINGTSVLGTGEDLPDLLEKHKITLVVLAIPSAPGQVIRRFTKMVGEAGVRIKTVPGLFDLLGNQTWVPDIKDVAIDDLLRREPVQLDQSALSQVIEGSVVLITGGGGSIGSELARQVCAFHPARIVLLGRGENSLWEAERQLRRQFPGQGLSIELCDIRNGMRLAQAFEKWRPAIVLHAAAHKHVPYLELHPAEGFQNNVLGTLNVVQEAQRVGAHTFVNISTDKAVNPANVLGATKFIAECIVLNAATTALPNQRFVSVRFGNVLGSRGSVISIFKDQIKHGGPLTVTHPDMTRYFMTIPEASQLALQAGVLGGNGKIFVLDMGEPVRISDLASDMARLSGLSVGRDIPIQFTGVRPGEKLFEEIFLEGEELQSSVHPKVFEGRRIPLDPFLLREGIEALSEAITLPEGERQREILGWLKCLVPTYRPSPLGLGRYDADSHDRKAPVEVFRVGSKR
jgi:FlaA1/EpsC-like NDP-sugar epimerase